MSHPTPPARSETGHAPPTGFVTRAATLVSERPTLALGGTLVILVIITGIIEPNYLAVSGVRNTLLQAAPLGILAGAQTILMLTGGIDLSVTMVATASAYVAANQSPSGAAVAILLGVVVGLVVGSANGVGVAVFRVNPLIYDARHVGDTPRPLHRLGPDDPEGLDPGRPLHQAARRRIFPSATAFPTASSCGQL